MNEAQKEIGRTGEAIAAGYLSKKGYEILDKNFLNDLGYKRGEIDIVAKDPRNNELVFVEVKTRKKSFYPTRPELAITRQKYRKLLKIIQNYLSKKNLHGRNWRLDAVAVEIDIVSRKARLKHLKYIYY